MNLPSAVASAYRKSLTISGRATRSEFWWFLAFVFVIATLIAVIEPQIMSSGATQGAGPLSMGWAVLNLLPLLALNIRRLHDCEVPGWLALIPLLPLAWQLLAPHIDSRALMTWHPMVVPIFVVLGVLALLANVAQLYLLVIRGTEGPNDYGPDPLEATA